MWFISNSNWSSWHEAMICGKRTLLLLFKVLLFQNSLLLSLPPQHANSHWSPSWEFHLWCKLTLWLLLTETNLLHQLWFYFYTFLCSHLTLPSLLHHLCTIPPSWFTSRNTCAVSWWNLHNLPTALCDPCQVQSLIWLYYYRFR